MEKLPNSFWGYIWLRFYSIQGLLLAVIGLIFSLITWFAVNASTSTKVLVITILVLVVLLVVAINAAYSLFLRRSRVLPKIIAVRPNTSVSNADFVCVLEPSEWFSQGILVSFYDYDGKYEQLIGIGRVLIVQDDGKIQVGMSVNIEGHEGIIERLSRSDMEAVERIKVKPHVPSDYFNMFLASLLRSGENG